MTTPSATPALPSLVAVATALPEHEAAQADARALVARMFQGTEAGSARLLQVFDHSGIERRSVCMPLEWYTASHTFEEQNGHTPYAGFSIIAATFGGSVNGPGGGHVATVTRAGLGLIVGLNVDKHF